MTQYNSLIEAAIFADDDEVIDLKTLRSRKKIVCRCGHFARDHAHRTGLSHPGETSTGACLCVLSRNQARESEKYHFAEGRADT